MLKANPLLQSRLLAEQDGAAAGVNARVVALQSLLQGAAASLQPELGQSAD